MTQDLSPWWAKDRHADRRPFLKARADIAKAVRAWFDTRGFIEVETGAVVASAGAEIHLHALKTALTGEDGGGDRGLSADLAGIRLQEAPGRR